MIIQIGYAFVLVRCWFRHSIFIHFTMNGTMIQYFRHIGILNILFIDILGGIGFDIGVDIIKRIPIFVTMKHIGIGHIHSGYRMGYKRSFDIDRNQIPLPIPIGIHWCFHIYFFKFSWLWLWHVFSNKLSRSRQRSHQGST